MLKIGLVGVGSFGTNHARILSEQKEIDFVGIYDQNEMAKTEIAKKYNVTPFENLSNLIKSVDALFIVVNTKTHYEIAKEALENGVDVFIEKPITETYEQATELIKIAEEKNLIIQVGHIERFNPIILKIQDKIKNPMFIEAHRIAPFSFRGIDVSVVQELMIHDIDFVLAFIDSKIAKIDASGSNLFTNKPDIANARIEFENGAVANITASRISLYKSRKLRIFQKDAYFSIDFQAKKAKYIKKNEEFTEKYNPTSAIPDNINPLDFVVIQDIDASDFSFDSLTMEIKSFINCVSKREKPIVDGEMGLRALNVANKIIQKIYNSKLNTN